MVQAWRRIVEQLPEWSIKPYQSNADEELVRKAGVVYFANRATLTVDLRLLQKAEASCGFSNFILAHEISHLELGHHSRKAVNLNFLLERGEKGNSVIPQNQLELEANFGAVVFQCGPALLDEGLSAKDLARKAFADHGMVRWARNLVRLEAFKRELTRQSVPKKRIVF